MQQYVCYLGYVSFVLVMYSLPGLVLKTMNYITPWRWSTKTETCRSFLKIGFNESDCF